MAHLTSRLLSRGPLIEVRIATTRAYREVLEEAGLEVPEPMLVRGLVDTGASLTCIDKKVIDQLGLKPTGATDMLTPSTGSGHVTVQLYDVSVSLLGSSPAEGALTFQSCSVAETELFEKQNYHALIGRDLLSRCLLVYNGKEKTFTLAY